MSDEDNDSFISEENNSHYIENIENSYKVYINHLGEILSDILDKIIRKNNLENLNNNEDENGEIILLTTMISEMEIFNTKKKPVVSVKKFLDRVNKYCQPEPSTLILSLIYLDKILLKTKTKLNWMNGFKLFYGCFVCSIKYNEDRHNSNKFYAKVCGVSFNDLLMMEYICLKYLEWNLFIDQEIYELYFNSIYSNNSNEH